MAEKCKALAAELGIEEPKVCRQSKMYYCHSDPEVCTINEYSHMYQCEHLQSKISWYMEKSGTKK